MRQGLARTLMSGKMLLPTKPQVGFRDEKWTLPHRQPRDIGSPNRRGRDADLDHHGIHQRGGPGFQSAAVQLCDRKNAARGDSCIDVWGGDWGEEIMRSKM